MTPKERQDRVIELRNKFTPITFNFVGKPDEKVQFGFSYLRRPDDPEILCIEPGCTGCTSLKLEGDDITGHLHLNEEYNATNGQKSLQITKNLKVWFKDDINWFDIDPDGVRMPNLDKIQVPLYIQGQVDLR